MKNFWLLSDLQRTEVIANQGILNSKFPCMGTEWYAPTLQNQFLAMRLVAYYLVMPLLSLGFAGHTAECHHGDGIPPRPKYRYGTTG